MRKKIVVIALVLTMLIVSGIIAFATCNSQITTYTLNEDKLSYTLNHYDISAQGEVVIPATYENLPVTAIAPEAFLKCENVTSVNIPKTVTSIGEFSLGYKVVNDEKVKVENFKIIGRAGTKAQEYAEQNGFAFNVFLTTPELVSAANSVNGVTVKWKSVENSAGYNVYRKIPKGKWSKIAYASGENAKSYVDTTAKTATKYIYTVRAVYDKDISGYEKAGVSVYYVKTPIVTFTNLKNGVQINWTKTDKATSYRVYKKVQGATKWTRIKTTKNNVFTYTDTNVTGGQRANYCVRAVINDQLSSYETKKQNVFLTQPTLTGIANTTKGIKITWDKIAGAEKYRVYRKINGSNWKAVKDVITTSFTDTNTTYGKKYDYTVRAVNGSTKSSHNKGLSIYAVAYPKLNAVKQGTNGLQVSWGKIQYCDNYLVYRKNDAGKWTKIYTTKNATTLSYTDKNVASGRNYSYTVVAYYKKSRSSYDSKGVTGMYFSSPVLNSVRCIKCKSMTINWSGVGGATSYTIHKKVAGGKWQNLATVPANTVTFTDTNIKVGNEYYYRVFATSASGVKSGYSKAESARVLDPKKPMVALTYDDGPSRDATTRILNVLEKYNGRATFFVVGSRVNTYKSQITRANSLKCEIANHSYNHKTLTALSASGVKSEISSTDAKIKAITGKNPTIMRPPGGSYNNSTVKANVGKPIIMWSIDTRDWESRNASSVASIIKRNVKDGSIILMHDLYNSTAAATETVVPWLVKNNYQIVTVSEMMDAKGITMQNGVAYNRAK